MRRAVLLTFALPALLAIPGTARADATGRVVVILASKKEAQRATAARAFAVAARAGGIRAGPSTPSIGLVVMRPRSAESPSALAARLRRDPAVRSAQPEQRLAPRLVPNDPALSVADPQAGGIPMQWPIAREGLPHAWDLARGQGGLVAVVDTGVEASHPDFSGKIARAVDQDGGAPGQDASGHGTLVASLACAGTGNGVGVAGTGFGCRLIVERTDFTESSIARSIVDATDHGADAINLSLGDDGTHGTSAVMRAAVDYAFARDVVLVAAAANQAVQEQGQPADLLQPTGTGGDLSRGKGLSVTAATYARARASFAGHGSQISLAAYGAFGDGGPRGLVGAFPSAATELERGGFGSPPERPCRCRTSIGGDPRYAYLQGTSMSAPQVAGIAALVRRLNPDLTAPDVLRLLKETAGGRTWEPQLGWGIVDAGAAVDAARRLDRTPPISRLRGPRRSGSRTFRLSWSGRDRSRPWLRASGLRRYELYAARASGRYKRIARTTRTSLRYTARAGGVYRFYTAAVDKAGNREIAPGRADATTRVAAGAQG
jgi:serine protease